MTRAEVGIDEFCVLPQSPERAEMLAQAEAALAQCSAIQRQVLSLCRGLDGPATTINGAARILGVPIDEARTAHDEACRIVADEIRRNGWTSETWAEAIAG